MTFKYIRIALLAFTFFLIGCFGLWDSGAERITGKYIVLWIDVSENQIISEQLEMNSSSSLEIVPAYVFAVGHNNDYIIAKQHPSTGFEGGYQIDTKITNYYIVDMNRKILKKGEKVFGPMDNRGFDSLRNLLNIEDVEFDQVYPDMP